MRKCFALVLLCASFCVDAQQTVPGQHPIGPRIVSPKPVSQTELKQIPQKAFARAIDASNRLKLGQTTGAIIGGNCSANQVQTGNDTFGKPICLNIVATVNVVSGTPSVQVNSDGVNLNFVFNLNNGNGLGGGGGGNNTFATLILQDKADGSCYGVTTIAGVLTTATASNCTGAVAQQLLTDTNGQTYAVTTVYGALQNTQTTGTGVTSVTLPDGISGTSVLSSQNGVLTTQH